MRQLFVLTSLLVATVLLTGCKVLIDPETGKWETQVELPKATLAPDATCGITTCHGLDIQCGQDVPEACTMEYRLGDFCQQYANCGIVEGQCQSQTSQLLAECISCVELCDSGLEGADPTKAFACEENCRQQLETMERSL